MICNFWLNLFLQDPTLRMQLWNIFHLLLEMNWSCDVQTSGDVNVEKCLRDTFANYIYINTSKENKTPYASWQHQNLLPYLRGFICSLAVVALAGFIARCRFCVILGLMEASLSAVTKFVFVCLINSWFSWYWRDAFGWTWLLLKLQPSRYRNSTLYSVPCTWWKG